MNAYRIHDPGTPAATPAETYPIPVFGTPTVSVTGLPATGVVPDGDDTVAWAAFFGIIAVLVIAGAIILRRRSNR
jgi:LPXTG-motif cell wall-anchored protein